MQEKILDVLSWMSLFLFFIALNSCNIDNRNISYELKLINKNLTTLTETIIKEINKNGNDR